MPTQTGTAVDPWRLDVASGVGLRAWREADTARDGTDTLVLALGADAALPVLTDLEAAVRAGAARPARSARSALPGQRRERPGPAATRGHRPDDPRPGLPRSPSPVSASRPRGRRRTGLAARVLGDGLSVTYTDPRTLVQRVHGIPLPEVAADGSVTFTPDWDQSRAWSPPCSAGPVRRPRHPPRPRRLARQRRPPAPRRPIADPGDALETWAARPRPGLRQHPHRARPGRAGCCSGGRLATPLGGGRPSDPYRCPIGGDPRAPGLAAWTVPGCPPARTTPARSPARLADLLRRLVLPDGPGLAPRPSRVRPARRCPTSPTCWSAGPGLGEGFDSAGHPLEGHRRRRRAPRWRPPA